MLKLLIVVQLLTVGGVLGQFSPTGPLTQCSNVAVQACNPNERYSRIDGSCNNLAFPWAGKANTPFKRYAASTYDDGWNAARSRATSGAPLPNPRVISRMISWDQGQTEKFYTHLLPLFGQFLAHDLTLAPTSTGSRGVTSFTLPFVLFIELNCYYLSLIRFEWK